MADKLLRVHSGVWINPYHVVRVVYVGSAVVIAIREPSGHRDRVKIDDATPEDADRIALAVEDAKQTLAT